VSGSFRPPRPPEGERRRQARAYEGAFEAVAAVIISALAGYWADGYFDSSPWFLLGGVVLGFAAMVIRLFRLGDEMNDVADEANKQEDTEDESSEK
jgi:F0F1-type ATP synthase assembly protein I